RRRAREAPERPDARRPGPAGQVARLLENEAVPGFTATQPAGWVAQGGDAVSRKAGRLLSQGVGLFLPRVRPPVRRLHRAEAPNPTHSRTRTGRVHTND